MTGLTRKEIRAIRQFDGRSGAQAQSDIERLNPATIVLHAWYSDPEFLEDSGKPKSLLASGEGATFASLCKKYAGDIPAGAMLAELRRARSVVDEPGGTLRPVSRYYTPTEFDESFVGSMAFSLENLARTLMQNATYSRSNNTDDLKQLGLMERYVWTTHLSNEDVIEFKKLAEQRAGELLTELDAWIGSRENKINSPVDGKRKQAVTESEGLVGLGVYLFEKGPGPDSD